MPLQNGNQAAANSVANFHGQNPQAPQMQQMLANPQFAAVLGYAPAASMMTGSVARPASATQNHPPNGQTQPPQAGRPPQQVVQQGLVQHSQHTANTQLAAYLHAHAQSQQQPHQPQGQPSGAQPTQPHQVLGPLGGLPQQYRTQLLQHRAQFSQLGPAEKQAWLEKNTDAQLKSIPNWHSKTIEEKAQIVFQYRTRQAAQLAFQRQQQLVYAQSMQRIAGQVGIGQVGQGMMANGMMANGMMANGMMVNGMMANGMMANGMMARMPGANPMAGMVGMPGTGMPGMMQNMGGMPLPNGMPGQLPPQ
jgi:hypothetical protein